jgi:selenium metabolism protein YedF
MRPGEKKTVDCRGQACPQPVINTKKALADAAVPILVIVDNQGSCINVQRFAESQGAKVSVEERDGEFHLTVEPGNTEPAAEEPPIARSLPPAGRTAVYVASETMGHGDDDLGATLMAAFLDTLSHFKDEISHAIFVNAGARLAVEGSPVLEQIRQLEGLGMQVLVCGTCLNHFGIKDKLAVGTVSNMYSIIEALSKADKVIRP